MSRKYGNDFLAMKKDCLQVTQEIVKIVIKVTQPRHI
jgi:hypothetical protein